MENRASSPAADQPISNTTDHPHLSGHILPRTTITNTGDVSSHGDVAVTSDVTTGARLVQVKMVSAALAACIAEATTIPLDTAKVRLQIQGERLLLTQEKPPHRDVTRANVISKATLAPPSSPKYRGMLRTLHVISLEEGFRALYNGLVPGLQRQLAFASIRIGLYDSVKAKYIELYQAEGTVSGSNIGPRILAGITTGAAAVGCAQPTDVVKVRMQAQSSGPKRYSGSINAYRTIAVQEGIRGLWKGLCPNMARNAIVNASELVSYDLIKEAILRRRLLSDNTPCHFVSAFGAGFCTTVVASPVDVVKTRFMNSGKGVYSGALQCATKMFREGGLATFYKGFMPSFMRVGSWNVAMFVSYEQIQRLFVTTRHPPNELTHSTASNATLAGSQEDVLPPAQHA